MAKITKYQRDVIRKFTTLKHDLESVKQMSIIERRLPSQLLDYLSFRWKDDVHEADVTGLDLHRRLRFETWLLGGAFFLRDDALEEELIFLHNIACTIRTMISNPKDEE